MSTILDQIVASKRKEIARASCSVESLARQLDAASPVRDFLSPLRNRPGVQLIAEVKKASPSAGIIRADFDPVAIAMAYERAGAACLSVLTDEHFFQGSLDNLVRARDAVACPVLRKDFVVDPIQVYEARAAGADAVLLIAECLPLVDLRELFGLVNQLGMTPLVELYDPHHLDRVMSLDPPLVGVNNRNLKTFEVDVGHVIELRKQIPDRVTLVAESGIRSNDDVRRLADAGIDAMLVGEHLMRSEDIASAVRELLRTA